MDAGSSLLIEIHISLIVFLRETLSRALSLSLSLSRETRKIPLPLLNVSYRQEKQDDQKKKNDNVQFVDKFPGFADEIQDPGSE